MKKFLELINKKWLVKGTTTIALIAIIFAVYIAVTVLLDKVTLPEFDTTENKIYSLSDETKEKISKIDEDITITLINYGEDSEKEQIANRYKQISDKIKVDVIADVSTRADLMQKYSLADSSTPLILVTCEDKEDALSSYDLSTIDYTTFENVDKTEEAITNAIIDVTTETKPKVYMLGTHTMYTEEYFGTLIQQMKNDANEVESLDILTTGKVPDDCNLLIIPDLKEDLSTIEKDSIISYINNGGELMLLTGPYLGTVNLSNCQEILNLYGISLEKGIIIEQSSGNFYYGIPDLIIEDETSNSTIKGTASNIKGCLLDASAIKVEEDEEKLETLKVEYETLMETSEKAFIRNDLTIDSTSKTNDDGEEGTYKIGVLATKKVNDEKQSKLVIYSSGTFATDISMGNGQIVLSNLYQNMDIVTNAVNYLNEREDIITISKDYDDTSYADVTAKQHYIILAITFGTPIAIIIAGIVVWQVRRRKK